MPRRSIRDITSAGASSRRSSMDASSTSRRLAPSCTISSSTRTNARTSSRPAPRPPRPCGRVWTRSSRTGRSTSRRRFLQKTASDSPPWATSARTAALQPAANAESLPDPKDKVGVLVKYREAVDLDRRAQTRGRTPSAAGGPRREPEHVRRLDSPGGDLSSAWDGCPRRMARISRPSGASPMKPARCWALRPCCPRWADSTRRKSTRSWRSPVSPAAAHQALANLALQQDRVDEALRQADLAGKADPTLPRAAAHSRHGRVNQDNASPKRCRC